MTKAGASSKGLSVVVMVRGAYQGRGPWTAEASQWRAGVAGGYHCVLWGITDGIFDDSAAVVRYRLAEGAG
jgi:hypothetical protein